MGKHSVRGVLTGKQLNVVGMGKDHVARHKRTGDCIFTNFGEVGVWMQREHPKISLHHGDPGPFGKNNVVSLTDWATLTGGSKVRNRVAQ